MPAALQPPSAKSFGKELIWKQPIDKLGREGKGDLPEQQLLMMYQVSMRSMSHYDCVAYMSAAEIHFQKNWKWSRCISNMQQSLYDLSSGCHASGGRGTAI